jgi:hypothetical protein
LAEAQCPGNDRAREATCFGMKKVWSSWCCKRDIPFHDISSFHPYFPAHPVIHPGQKHSALETAGKRQGNDRAREATCFGMKKVWSSYIILIT